MRKKSFSQRACFSKEHAKEDERNLCTKTMHINVTTGVLDKMFKDIQYFQTSKQAAGIFPFIFT